MEACQPLANAVLWCTPPPPPTTLPPATVPAAFPLPQAVATRPAAARQPALAAVQHAAARRHPQQRRSLVPCRAADTEAEAQVQAGEGAEAVKPKLMSEAWETVIQMKQEGTIVETTVKGANKSGGCMHAVCGGVGSRRLAPACEPAAGGRTCRQPRQAACDVMFMLWHNVDARHWLQPLD